MSTKRLNSAERVAYSVGKAIIDALKNPTRDPDRKRELAVVMRLLEGILSAPEFDEFMLGTGLVSEDLYEELMGRPYDSPKEGEPNDEIPF